MKRVLVIVAGVALVAAARQASGCGYGMPSPAMRFVQAECVIAGKVVAIESRKLMLQTRPNTQPLPHAVAVLKIGETIKGDDRLTHVRLALPMHQAMPVGFEGCFFLTTHAEQPVFTMSSRFYDYPIQKENNPGFDKQVDEFKKLARLLRDPQAGLKSQNASDRFLTAAMLVTQLRTFQSGVHVAADKTQPIDAELSKLILWALAECDWNREAADFRLTPWRIFNLLGATEKDGYKQQGPDPVGTAKRWLKDSEETFRIKTFVRR